MKHKQPKKEKLPFIKKFWWLFPIIFICTATAYSYLLLSDNKQGQFNSETDIIKDCLGTTNESNIDCWYERYEAIVAQSPDTKKAFEDVKIAYEKSSYAKSNCHPIAHIIGRASAKKYGDVSKSFEQGDNFCWSGYYHGVMESVVATTDKQEILATLNNICEGPRSEREFSFFHYNCVHGLGHGIMQLQDNELFTALNTCDDMEGLWQQESCQGGVFMENVMNEINPGHESKYLNDTEPLYPCTAVENKYKQQCYLMQTSHALIVVGQDFSKVFKLCSEVSVPYDITCFQSLGRDASGHFSSNQQKTISLCNLGGTVEARENCYIGAVKDFISYYNNADEARLLCAAIEEIVVQNVCVTTAEDYYRTL